MNSEEIKRLLERYYNGESTGEEERLLKEFFSQTDIPEDLDDEKEIFRYYVQSAGIPEPSSDFESRIISALDSIDRNSLRLKQRRIYRILTGIAAGLLILIGSYFLFINRSGPHDTFSDPELAYAETMKILYNVSVRLNNGTRVLEPVGKMQDITAKSLEAINKPAGILEEKMKALDKFRRTIEVLDAINNEKQNNNQ
jgi:hypothetical protein